MTGYRVERQADGILAVLPGSVGHYLTLAEAFARAQVLAGWTAKPA